MYDINATRYYVQLLQMSAVVDASATTAIEYTGTSTLT